MNVSLPPLPKLAQDQDVLGELLHSLSQPLTSLRCSLELSIDEVAEQQQETVAAALEQTDRVIAMVRLMREYLEPECSGLVAPQVPLAATVRTVVERLSSVAAACQVGLHLAGDCTAWVPVLEPRLRVVLQYLIGMLIEAQPASRAVTLRLEESPTGSVLRAQGEQGSFQPAGGSPHSQPGRDPVSATLRRVKLAIASRVLESAGASLAFDDGDKPGFVLRVPRRPTSSNPSI